MYGAPVAYPSPMSQPPQQRLQMMEAQFPQYTQQPTPGYQQGAFFPPQMPSPQGPGMLKGRPVSNEEEANAAMIDFDGSLFVFPDKAHGKIYTKQLGLDGNIVFLRYTLDATPATPATPVPTADPSVNPSDFVRREDLEKTLSALNQRLAQIENRQPVDQKGGK